MPERSSLEIAADVLGRIPSGCSVLTAANAGRSSGMIVSWVQQASFEPLLLSVAIRRGRPMLEMLDVSGRFVLNPLGDDPKPMLRHFARGFRLDEPAFDGLSCRQCEYGVILEDALGYLECMIESHREAGDHWLYLARPVRAGMSNAGEAYVHTRKSALIY